MRELDTSISSPFDLVADRPPLWQLIYGSVARCRFSPKELTGLLTRARVKNQASNISGMLVYRETYFLQVLEGPRSVVEQLFETIARDPRHDKVTILMNGRISVRSFGDWRMGFVQGEDVELPPGFSDFFSKSFSTGMFAHNAGLARRLLLAFRQTRWQTQVCDI